MKISERVHPAAVRVAKAVAAASLSASAVLGLSACAPAEPPRPAVACDPAAPAAQLPDHFSLSRQQEAFLERNDEHPTFHMMGSQNGVELSWGTVTASSDDTDGAPTSAANPCAVSYGSSKVVDRAFWTDNTVTHFESPEGARYTLAKEPTEDGKQYVVRGPDGAALALQQEHESFMGVIRIELRDPSTGAMLATAVSQKDPNERWSIDLSSDRVPPWLLTHLAARATAENAEAANQPVAPPPVAF